MQDPLELLVDRLMPMTMVGTLRESVAGLVAQAVACPACQGEQRVSCFSCRGRAGGSRTSVKKARAVRRNARVAAARRTKGG